MRSSRSSPSSPRRASPSPAHTAPPAPRAGRPSSWGQAPARSRSMARTATAPASSTGGFGRPVLHELRVRPGRPYETDFLLREDGTIRHADTEYRGSLRAASAIELVPLTARDDDASRETNDAPHETTVPRRDRQAPGGRSRDADLLASGWSPDARTLDAAPTIDAWIESTYPGRCCRASSDTWRGTPSCRMGRPRRRRSSRGGRPGSARRAVLQAAGAAADPGSPSADEPSAETIPVAPSANPDEPEPDSGFEGF